MLVTVGKQYDLETIPDNQFLINVYQDKHLSKKQRIFSELTKQAKAGHYQLTLLRLNSLNGQTTKSVYRFNPTQPVTQSLFNSVKLHQLSKQELQLQDTVGTYYTNASQADAVKIQRQFKQLGLESDLNQVSFLKQFVASSTLANYLLILISLLAVLFTVMVMEKLAAFKDYAILKLNGLRTTKIIARDSKQIVKPGSLVLLALIITEIVYGALQLNLAGLAIILRAGLLVELVILLVVFALEALSYLALLGIDLYTAIKGNLHSKTLVTIGYVVKALLLALVFVNLFALQTNLKSLQADQAIIKVWNTHSKGYIVQLGQVNQGDKAAEKQLENQVTKLIKANPSVIMSRNSQQFHPDINDSEPENGNVLVVNANYLRANHFYDLHNRLVNPANFQGHVIYALIPQARKQQARKFNQQIRSFVKFQHDLAKSKSSIKIKRIFIQNEPQVFNYTIGNELKDSVSNMPMIMVDPGTLSADFYLATVSQGMMQFGNLNRLQQSIRKLNLTDKVVGITDAKTRLSEFNAEVARKLTLTIITIVITLSQLLFIIVFLSLMFLEKERKRFAIRKVFGQSNQGIVAKFFLANAIIDLVIINLLAFKFASSWQFVFCSLALYLVIEGLILAGIAKHAEQDLLVTLNHGN